MRQAFLCIHNKCKQKRQVFGHNGKLETAVAAFLIMILPSIKIITRNTFGLAVMRIDKPFAEQAFLFAFPLYQ
jgi:acetyl-CoA carboxylase carboxyltransferase component